MLEHRIDSIPIVGLGGELNGLVTSIDLLELLIEDEREGQVLPFDFKLRMIDAAVA